MALLNKIFTHVQKKKDVKRKPDSARLWTTFGEETDAVGVRILLFRECEQKGKKLLFDSDAVERVLLKPDTSSSELNSYTETNDGFGFIYLTPDKDVKLLSEMILGSVAMVHQEGNLKIHTLPSLTSRERTNDQTCEKRLMWSSIFQAPRITQGMKSSDTSLGSSFGCSLGSFPSDTNEYSSLSLFPEILERQESQDDSRSQPSYSSSIDFPSFTSISDVHPGRRRRLSSNVDLPDYGSLCILQTRWRSNNGETNSHVDSGFMSDPAGSSASLAVGGNASYPTNLCGDNHTTQNRADTEMHPSEESAAVTLKQGGKNALLGLGLVVRMPEHLEHLLFQANIIFEDIYNHLLQTVQQAYIQKRRFVCTMHQGYLDTVRLLQRLLSVPHLQQPAWHLCLKDGSDRSIEEKLLSELCHLKSILDTKETNFLLSTLLTGVLTYHLGWVSTVMPGSSEGHNALHKPRAVGMDGLRSSQWYSPTNVQFKELYGMLGNPVRAAKSLVLCSDPDLGRQIVFVLSYFIRCCLVLESDLEPISDDFNSVQYHPYLLKKRNTPAQETGFAETSSDSSPASNQPHSLTKSSSSPSLTLHQVKKSCLPTALEALDLDSTMSTSVAGGTNDHQKETKVGFVIGELDESPQRSDSISSHQQQTSFDGKKVSPEQSKNKSSHKRSNNANRMRDSSGNMGPEMEPMFVTHVEMDFSEAGDNLTPAELSGLMACGDEYLPGCVLQATITHHHWRSQLQADLSALAANSLVTSVTSDCVCVVCDLDKTEVSLVSAHQVVVGRPGLPVPMSPLVAGILDGTASLAALGLPVDSVLNYLEDQLQQLYLQSCVLAEFLLTTDFSSLQTISKQLDLDPADIPLLLAVASTHTPAVGKKFSLGFTG